MSKYINNLTDCLLTTFTKCLDTRNYKELLLEGEYDEKESQEAWLLLHDLFHDALKSTSVSTQFRITKQIESKKNDYIIIQNCIKAIGMIHQINLIGALSDDFEPVLYDEFTTLINSYNFKFDVKKGINEELKRVQDQSKVYLSNIQSDIKKLEKQNELTKDWHFTKTIAHVSKFMGYRMSKEVNLQEFADYYNMMIDSKPKEPAK